MAIMGNEFETPPINPPTIPPTNPPMTSPIAWKSSLPSPISQASPGSCASAPNSANTAITPRAPTIAVGTKAATAERAAIIPAMAVIAKAPSMNTSGSILIRASIAPWKRFMSISTIA